MQAIIVFLSEVFTTHSAWWLVGQAFGIVAMAFSFLAYQLKTQSKLLLMQGASSFLFCIHYALLGAYTGLAMNAVAMIRNLAYNRFKNNSKALRLIPFIFIAILCGISIVTWDGWYSIFAIIGIVINTYCMSFKNIQHVRLSVVVSSPLVLTYNVFSFSVGGIINEIIAIISAVLAIFRNKKKMK